MLPVAVARCQIMTVQYLCASDFVDDVQFSANVNYVTFAIYTIARPSVCRLSVVCNVGAPYSGG